MNEILVTGPSGLKPTHPGEVLQEDVLPSLRLTVTEAAKMMQVSRQNLHNILSGRIGLSADMAVRIGKLCGNGPQVWISLQMMYDVWEAEHKLKELIDKIPTLQAIDVVY